MGGSIDVVSALGRGQPSSPSPCASGRATRRTLEGHLIPDDDGSLGALLAGRRILLVDDHPLNRGVAEAALRRFGADVDIAWDGLGALERFVPRRYDAIVLDVRMPNMDGYDAAREIRRLEDEAMASRDPHPRAHRRRHGRRTATGRWQPAWTSTWASRSGSPSSASCVAS